MISNQTVALQAAAFSGVSFFNWIFLCRGITPLQEHHATFRVGQPVAQFTGSDFDVVSHGLIQE